MLPDAVAVIIPAKDEQARLAATLASARTIPGVDLVVVVDDGSSDSTAQVALDAGAVVLRHARNRGKGAAMATGATWVSGADNRDGRERVLLFLDADLEATANRAAPLVDPVLRGLADMAIAVLPPQRRTGGGHGFVVRLARDGIVDLTGWTPTQPLSGQRCLTLRAFTLASPLARGFGVETGLTVDLLRAGLTVVEVEADLEHRVTGRDWRAQRHRGRQYRDVLLALLARGWRRPSWATR